MGDIPYRKLKIPSGVKKKISWNTIKLWVLISDLQKVSTNCKAAVEKIAEESTGRQHKFAILENSEDFTK